MEAQTLFADDRSWWIKSFPALLAVGAGGVGAIAISMYLWTQYQEVSAGNWLAAVLVCLGTVFLVGPLIRSHSYKPACAVLGVGIVCTAVGFFWGLIGIVLFCWAAVEVIKLIAWLAKRQPSSQLRNSGTSTLEPSDEVKALAADPRKKMAAIKAYRTQANVGLYEAKAVIEQLASSTKTPEA